MNMTKALAAVCELEVGGQNCGVQAVGRCAFCKRAFCAAHQAWSGQTYYIDQCAPCLAQAQADKEKGRREAEAKYRAEEDKAREYIQSGSARIALLTNGVQPVNIYQTQRKMRIVKKGFFSRDEQWVEVVTSVRHGWILGAIFGKGNTELTALLDLDHRQVILTPVEPYAESYKEVDSDYLSNWEVLSNWEIARSGWMEAAQAVRRLIELRHLEIESIFTRRITGKQDENSPKRVQTLAGRSGFIRIEEGKEPGRIYEIHEELSIGRSRDRAIFLENLDDELHATIINQGNSNYALRVDTKRNITKINGQLLPRGSQTYPLQDGDHIQLSTGVTVAWRIMHGYLKRPEQIVLVFGMK